MTNERRMAIRLAHLTHTFVAVLDYVRGGHPFRFRSGGNSRGDLVVTMTMEEPEVFHNILEPGTQPRE